MEGRKVKNRDIPLLGRVMCRMADICKAEEDSEWLTDRMHHITRQITGMPRGGAAAGFDSLIAELGEKNERLKARMNLYLQELKQVEKILNGIGSPTMRTFVVMMYVDNVPHATVQRELNMTRYTFERAKAAIENAECMAKVVWRERFEVVGE